ncbi:hypothetical protein R9C00_10470 [Flammeovirgaceae bacterium SG7u.111]|nr:hypothetical protein [Flammeovirgaceae bacterium SG7u.132]WPO37877.1 hypothetical protein R9C00_10470 [Flammeovirgaceae bacterium SG7u.111]
MREIYLCIICSLLLASFQGCKTDSDCGACFTPPSFFTFEIVDINTGENLFTNGTFDPNQLVITATLDGKSENVTYNFIEENGLNQLEITSVGWESGISTTSVSVGDTYLFNLTVDAERVSEDCCNFTRYNEININDAMYTLDPVTSAFYIVSVDLGE